MLRLGLNDLGKITFIFFSLKKKLIGFQYVVIFEGHFLIYYSTINLHHNSYQIYYTT